MKYKNIKNKKFSDLSDVLDMKEMSGFELVEVEGVLKTDSEEGWVADSIKFRARPKTSNKLDIVMDDYSDITLIEFKKLKLYTQLKEEIKKEILQDLKNERGEMMEDTTFRDLSYEDAKKEIVEFLIDDERILDTLEIAETLKIDYCIVDEVLTDLNKKGLVSCE